MRGLGRVGSNARISILVLPMWSVFWGLVYFYSPLYMKENGLSEVQIGLANTVNIVFAFLCQLVASPITNKLGRRRTTLIFDLLSWSASMAIWAIAHNVWFFLFAAIVNAFSKIVSVSWNCLITEDEKRENIPRIYMICSLINSSIGIFALASGFLIARYGLVDAMRTLYAVGAVSMAISFVTRHFVVEETSPGVKLMNEHDQTSLLTSVGNYLKMMLRLHENRRFVLLAVVFITTNFILSLNLFQVIYLKDQLHFAERTISTVPFAIAVANIVAFMLIIPRLRAIREERVLAACCATSLIGALLFLIIPPRNLVAMLAVMAANGVSLFILQAYRDSIFMNSQGEHDKADMFSAVQTLTSLFCIPAGYVGGVLYKSHPALPFVLVAVFYLMALAVSLSLLASRPAHAVAESASSLS